MTPLFSRDSDNTEAYPPSEPDAKSVDEPTPTVEEAHDPGIQDGDERDEQATEDDLKESGVDIFDPAGDDATEATIELKDHKFEVAVKGNDFNKDGDLTAVEDISDDDLAKLRKVLSEETAKRGTAAPRPFIDVDKESLLVLQNQIRGELASR